MLVRRSDVADDSLICEADAEAAAAPATCVVCAVTATERDADEEADAVAIAADAAPAPIDGAVEDCAATCGLMVESHVEESESSPPPNWPTPPVAPRTGGGAPLAAAAARARRGFDAVTAPDCCTCTARAADGTATGGESDGRVERESA